MAKPFFTTEDIKEFLSKNNLNWTGFIYNDETMTKTYASDEDFEYSEYSTIVMEVANEHTRNSFVDMFITNFSFLTYTDDSKFMENGSFQSVDKDLSSKWQNYLLQKYHSDYAEILFAWCIHNINEINTETADRIRLFTSEETKKANSEIAKFNEIAKKAMHCLNAETLQKFDNTNI